MTDPYALLVVGGGPAALSAVRAYREAATDGAVAIVSDEGRMPYSRPPLTKDLLRGESTESELPLEEDRWLDDNRVDLIAGRAVAVDSDEREVLLSGGRTLGYACCLLATGAEPTRLPIPGADHPAVHVIRTPEHVRRLTARLRDDSHVVVVGSGFIGCEIAASLRVRGHAVELVSDESEPNIARLGEAQARILREWLAQDGVGLHLGASVSDISHGADGVVVTAGDERIVGDLVVMAAGVAPRSELASQAGIELAGGAIPVSAAMRTERDGLLAAGDVCLADNLAAGRPLRVEHWGDALGQGEIAGATAAGVEAGWDAVPGFWSTIGARTLKYAAWGDGFDATRLHRDDDGAFVAWYGREGKIAGVLTHQRDGDYERGRELIAGGSPWPP
ncbi:MAG TPA: FAD-dependent oxidoreductase [Solirubrobacteraceae bacterium]|nr:FAD-dependent oxidoreductase [Solirubrobacteraceae bacterium]